MLKVLFCLIFALATLAADTQDIDAFNRPLKFSTTSLCELLALDPTMPGFIPVSFRESIRQFYRLREKDFSKIERS